MCLHGEHDAMNLQSLVSGWESNGGLLDHSGYLQKVSLKSNFFLSEEL